MAHGPTAVLMRYLEGIFVIVYEQNNDYLAI